MKSFQKSSEMSMITYVFLSLPWTDWKVPSETAAERCLLVRMWASITLVLWNMYTFFGGAGERTL